MLIKERGKKGLGIFVMTESIQLWRKACGCVSVCVCERKLNPCQVFVVEVGCTFDYSLE